jgi:hypothetical protein
MKRKKSHRERVLKRNALVDPDTNFSNLATESNYAMSICTPQFSVLTNEKTQAGNLG